MVFYYSKKFQSTSAKEYLELIFPRTASCNFKSGGIAGGPNLGNLLCVLAPNALSEKIFVILWFWYGILALITSLNLILIISMMFPSSFIRKLYLARAVLTRKVILNTSIHHRMIFFKTIFSTFFSYSY